MRAEFEPLTLAGYSYDPRTVAAPLEALMLRAAIAGRGSRDAGLAGVFLMDYDAVLADRRQRVHSVAFTGGPQGNRCSCGLVMGTLDPVTAGGHLDTWTRTDLVVVAHGPDLRLPARHAVVCHACGWAVPAGSAEDGHGLRASHHCESESRATSPIAMLRQPARNRTGHLLRLLGIERAEQFGESLLAQQLPVGAHTLGQGVGIDQHQVARRQVDAHLADHCPGY